MPGTCASFGRSSWMISSAESLRCDRGFSCDEDDARVAAADAAARAAAGHERRDVRVAPHDGGDGLLVLHHRGEGDPLRALGEAEDLARVLARQEALGDRHEEPDRSRRGSRPRRPSSSRLRPSTQRSVRS